MYTRILTRTEREKIKTYLQMDGERDSTIRSFVSRARRYENQLKQDLRLLERLVTVYERQTRSKAQRHSWRSR
jgi:hypothetical protein